MTVLTGAKLMRQFHVGNVIVADESEGGRVPVGIVTDRDIVLEVLAQDVDPSGLSLADIMSRDLLTVNEKQSVFEAVHSMCQRGVRRAPVVDDAGKLAGIVAIDDLLELFADQLGELTKLIAREQKEETMARP